MIFEVSHRTTYRYSLPVSISHHLVHLTPRNAPWQACSEALLEVSPAPGVRVASDDYFGNPVIFLTVQQGHRELVFHALSIVEVSRRLPIDPAATPAAEEVRARLETDRSDDALDAIQYAFPSPSTPWHAEMRDYALISFPPGRPILQGARDLTHRIFTDFAYDPRATTIQTSVQQAFKLRRGVCQDFAHIQLACLRALGLPARYVSGYLLTRPKEGKERLVGADASHAWVSVWVPGHGWVDLDPTNDLIVRDEHITLAWGRDYGDVSPVSGIMFGGGEHTVHVAVNVMPLTEHRATA